MNGDYRMQYYDVITDPRWRTAADMKIVCDRWEIIRLWWNFYSLNQILIKIIWSKFKLLNSKWRTQTDPSPVCLRHCRWVL